MKKKVVNIQKNQQIKYTKLIITILFLIAIAAVSNYSETIAAEKARKRSGYSYPNLYDSKIDHTLYGDDLYSKIPTNVPINIDEKIVTVQGQKIFLS